MAASLKQAQSDLTVELIQGDRGVFDVREGERLIFSKKTEGHFPSAAEVVERLK